MLKNEDASPRVDRRDGSAQAHGLGTAAPGADAARLEFTVRWGAASVSARVARVRHQGGRTLSRYAGPNATPAAPSACSKEISSSSPPRARSTEPRSPTHCLLTVPAPSSPRVSATWITESFARVHAQTSCAHASFNDCAFNDVRTLCVLRNATNTLVTALALAKLAARARTRHYCAAQVNSTQRHASTRRLRAD
jgi:hypothetical protein